MNQQVKPSQYGYGKASLENYRSRHYYKSSITLYLTTHISNEKRCYKGDIWRVVSYYLKKNHPNYNLSLSKIFLWKNEVKEANADHWWFDQAIQEKDEPTSKKFQGQWNVETA